MATIKEKTLHFLSIVVLLATGLVIYLNSLWSPFQFDDHVFIANNPATHDITNPKAIWHALAHPSRFIAFYSFALNYHFHGLDVFGYHLVNFAIHLTASMFVWWLVQLLCQTPRLTNKKITQHKNILAFFAALLFLTHPIQTQAITYITQRFTSMAAMFYLSSLCFYLKGRLGTIHQNKYFIGSLIGAVWGTFTKQIVFTLPFMIASIEFFFLTPASRKEEGRRFKLIAALWGLFLLIIPAFFAFNASKILFLTMPSGSHDGDVITSWNYFLTQPRVILTYIRLLFFPINQNVDYDFPLSQNLLEWKTLLSLLTIIILIVLSFKIRYRHRLISFGILWFFLTLSVESSFIPIHHVIFEHRLYLPSVGFVIAFCAWALTIFKNTRGVVALLIMTVFIFSYLTIQRNKIWQSEEILWQDVVKKSPNKSRGFKNLGSIYYKESKLDLGLEAFNKAIEIKPDDGEAYNNRGAALMQKGLFDSALDDFNHALALNPHSNEVYDNRGELFKRVNKYPQAFADFSKSIALNPNYAKAYNNRGVLYGEIQQYENALSDFNKALAIDGGFADAYNNRGVVYLRRQMLELAMSDFNKTIGLNPHNAESYSNRGSIYQQRNQLKEALEDYNKALNLRGNFSEVFNNRGIILGQLGHFELAILDFKMALQVNPEFIEAYNNLGMALKANKQFSEAIQTFNQAIRLDSQYAVAYYNRSLVLAETGQFTKALDNALKAKQLGFRIEEAYINQLKQLIVSGKKIK